MGKISILTKNQREILDQVTNNDFLKKNFYLTGGTALSEFYLQHRYSEDLDFFTEKEYDTQLVNTFIRKTSQKFGFTIESELLEFLYRFNLKFFDKQTLKLDFSYYPGKRVEKGLIYNGMAVDSLLDIAINKLSTIQQRHNVKDYVDLYFLLEKFSLWDLIEGVRIKFRTEIEPWLLSSDLIYGVEKFESLPQMIKPLTLHRLKKFFREKAVEIGKKAVTA